MARQRRRDLAPDAGPAPRPDPFLAHFPAQGGAGAPSAGACGEVAIFARAGFTPILRFACKLAPSRPRKLLILVS